MNGGNRVMTRIGEVTAIAVVLTACGGPPAGGQATPHDDSSLARLHAYEVPVETTTALQVAPVQAQEAGWIQVSGTAEDPAAFGGLGFGPAALRFDRAGNGEIEGGFVRRGDGGENFAGGGIGGGKCVGAAGVSGAVDPMGSRLPVFVSGVRSRHQDQKSQIREREPELMAFQCACQ